ncbi:fused MFS/spermidine synthase [Falsiroseomonas bella]|uniref:fused MFS/spermidine synthase n=1 Tax=Falsiroseomonas bella TaxID=2184016 RepID=UPI00130506DC|nr:fused MFS/spermidine synthase [Falsiroseomonas bella]
MTFRGNDATRPRALGDAATILLASALGLVVEIVAGRLLAPHVGMSLHSWTAIIAVVLGGFSLGHWWGGRLAEGDRRTGHRRLAWLLAGCAATCLLAVPALRLAAPVFDAEGVHPLVAILGLAIAGFFLPSLLVGAVSPIVTKLAVEEARAGEVGRVLGRLFALSALGAIAGTLLAGFVFVAWIGSTGTMLACAAAYGLMAAGHAVAAARRARSIVASAGVAAALLLPLGIGRLPALASACDAESAYFCIRVVDIEPVVGQPARLMVLDHLAHGANVRDEPGLLVQSYLHLADEIVAHRGLPASPSAFFVGGGAFTLPRAWAAAHPGGRFTVAEIDPAVSAAARRDFWLEEGEALRIVAADGRVALQATAAVPAHDVILADAFLDIAMPVHLATREWHQAVRARLKPGGAYLANVMEDKREPRFLFALARTLMMDFPVVEVWVEMAEAEGRRVTYLLLASDTPTPAGRIVSRNGPSRGWARLPDAVVRQRIAASGVPVLTDDFAPVDRLMTHLVWSREGSGR